jgi:hypothetical protein
MPTMEVRGAHLVSDIKVHIKVGCAQIFEHELSQCRKVAHEDGAPGRW